MLKSLFLPPGALFLLILLGVLLGAVSRRGGRTLIALGIIGLYLLSTPFVSQMAIQRVIELTPEPGAGAPEPQAIVVLGGTFNDGNPPEVGRLTLERLHLAAIAHRETGLPILASAGPVTEAEVPGSRIMRQVLEDDFDVPVEWIEETSRDTWTNAKDSAAILQEAGIESVYLVSQAWHMPRAVRSFRWNALAARPAPPVEGEVDFPSLRLQHFLPNPRAMETSYYAAYEYAGLLWYRWEHAPE